MATYKVINFDENTGQLVIDFALGMAPITVDVPIKDGLYITGQELNSYVEGFIPTWHIERQTQVNSGVANAAELKKLVQETATIEIPTVLTVDQIQEQATQKMWAELEFERNVAKALIKFGVLTSNPTEISVNTQ
jgi:hypothetical protein